MKRLLAALITVSLSGNLIAPAIAAPPSPSPSPAASPIEELVKGGTPVDVSLQNDINSRDVSQGTTVPVVVSKNVSIAGMIVIPKGSIGQATLTKVQGAGGNGSGGQITFQVNWVYSADGGKIALSDNDNASENADRKGEASTLAIAGYLTFGVLGLFSHNIARGKDAVISKDKVFHVFVDHDVHVIASQSDDTQTGFDH